MSPRTQSQLEAIREEKRARILDAALNLFGYEGYHNSSISKIAQQAGISKGLVYNYFESKEEIVQEILNSGIEEMLKILDPNQDGVLDASEIEYFIVEMFGHIEKNEKFWKLYFSISLQPVIYPMFKEKIDELAKPIVDMAVSYFKKCGFEDPEGETLIFGALLDGIGFHYIMDPRNYPLEKVKHIIIERYVQHPKKD